MKNRLFLYAVGAVVLGLICGVSHQASQAQPASQVGQRPKSAQVPYKPGQTAVNSTTKPILSKSFRSWDSVHRAVVAIEVNEHRVPLSAGAIYSQAKEADRPLKIQVKTQTTVYATGDNYYTAIEMARVSLRNSQGKTLITYPANEQGEYDFYILKAGRFTLAVEMIGPNGKPMHRNPALRSEPRFTSDLSQYITLDIKQARMIPADPSKLYIEYGQWKPSKEANVWQRSITPAPTVSALDLYQVRFIALKIVPVGGFRLNPKVSWLEATYKTISGVKETEWTQYYRALSPIPEGSSRQTGVYQVAISVNGPELTDLDFRGGFK